MFGALPCFFSVAISSRAFASDFVFAVAAEFHQQPAVTFRQQFQIVRVQVMLLVMKPTSSSSMPSRPIGLMLHDFRTMIARAENVRDNRARGANALSDFGINIIVASRMVTQVPSLPASARATLKPFSGNKSSRL